MRWMVGTLLSAAILVWVYQGYRWWNDGTWTDLPFGILWTWLGYGYPAFAWSNVQRTILWVLGQPLAAALFLLSAVGFLIVPKRA